MTPYQLELHAQHKARKQRFANAADRHQWNAGIKADAIIAAQLSATLPVDDEPEVEPISRREYETPKRAPVYVSIVARTCKAVADEFGLTVDELNSPDRHGPRAVARFVAILILLEMTRLSLSAIGRHLGGRDHTTIIHGRDRALQLCQSEAFRNRVDQIKAGLV